MANNFEKTSLDWEIHRWQMQIGEAVEKVFQSESQSENVEIPTRSLPDWVLKALFWMLILSLALWALWRLYQLLQPSLAADRVVRGGQPQIRSITEPNLSEAQWLERSRSLAQQGDYRQACRALYQALLLKLDATALIPAEPSRTDGEYLRCLQVLSNPQPCRTLIQVHEELCFSHTPITQETFRRCEQAYRELELS